MKAAFLQLPASLEDKILVSKAPKNRWGKTRALFQARADLDELGKITISIS